MSAIDIYPYQRRWIEDKARFKAAMFSRQSGKTFTSTLEVCLDSLEREAGGGRSRWVILSRGERQAREAIEEGVKRHLQALQAGFKAYEIEWETGHKALEVTLPGGSRITALPANPDTARGFSASVLLDEFAFHQDSRKIWGALFPVVSRGDLKLRVISTPNGKSNKFYDLMTQGGCEPLWREHGIADAGVWSVHACDIYQAVADGLPRDIDELRAGVGDADIWSQEYELKWLDEASAWLDFELINAVESDQAGDPDGYLGGVCYVGVDIAARRDLFVIWVFELVGDVLVTREVIAQRRIAFAEQDALLEDVFRRYRVGRCCIDQTGIGEKPVEDAKRRHGSYTVEGVLFTSANKQMLATLAKQKFEDRRVRIPQGDAAIRSDLHSLKRTVLPSGAFRFDADRDANGHADRAWACFLAIFAADVPYQPAAYLPVRPGARRNPMRDDDDEDERDVRVTGGFKSRAGVM